MATICPFNRAGKNKTARLPVAANDRELELLAILTVAEMAFDQVYCAREDMAAA